MAPHRSRRSRFSNMPAAIRLARLASAAVIFTLVAGAHAATSDPSFFQSWRRGFVSSGVALYSSEQNFAAFQPCIGNFKYHGIKNCVVKNPTNNMIIRRRRRSPVFALFDKSSTSERNQSALTFDTQNSVSNELKQPRDYFVSEALFVHMGPAARILTEEFYSHRTNFITFQIERLKTLLSLESTFPIGPSANGGNFLSQPLKQMFVACNSKDGTVVGFAEVDASPFNSFKSGGQQKPKNYSTNNINRPYMYNLAVDKRWKRKGVATALIGECENFVREMHRWRTEKVDVTILNDDEDEDDSFSNNSIPQLFLRVRKSNDAAIALYKSMGYEEIDPSSIAMSNEELNSGSAEEGELVLFAKDLLMDPSNALNCL